MLVIASIGVLQVDHEYSIFIILAILNMHSKLIINKMHIIN